MPIKFLNDIDLNRNELQFAAIHNNNGNPSGTAVVGQMSYNTADNKLYVYNGTWTALTTSVDTNTTYTMATGPVGTTTIRLTGSDASTNDVTLTGAGSVTVTRTSATQLTITGGASGTVTSVAALTLGTIGTDLSSSVANGGTTPVITLNVPTASASNRGALSSADWSTFNGKENVLTFSSPLVRTTNTISIPAATTSVDGYLTSTDWTTFNGKQAALVSGTNIKTVNNTSLLGSGDVSVGVTSVAGTAPVVSSGGATPIISMAAATASVSGYLTSTDWNTFNDKQATGVSVLLAGSTMNGLLVLSADPSAALGAATKQYVDNVAQGLDVKGSVVVATTANISLSGTQTIDGVTLVAGDRVLVKDQTTASQNGIYVVASGAWTRATDMNTWAEVPGAFTFIERGTAYTDTGWVCTSNAGGTIGTTAITFTQFSGAGAGVTQGTGITINAGVISTTAAQTHVTSLGTLSGLTVTNTINGSITGNAGTVTTNASLTGPVTSSGNITAIANGAITNAMLANNQLTVGTTAISLGGTSTTLAGLTSVTSNGFTGALTGNASTATSIAGGSAGTIPYQTGPGATSFTALGTAGVVASGLTTTPESVLTTNGTSAPSWKKRTYAVTLAGTGASETITHGLATKDVIVQLYDLTTGETVMADIVRVNASPYNTVTITFSAAPGANTVRALVTKI